MTITTSASIGGVIGKRKHTRAFALQYKGANIMAWHGKKGKKSYAKKGKKMSYGRKKKK
jgi:ribosome biogenesis protein Nip4